MENFEIAITFENVCRENGGYSLGGSRHVWLPHTAKATRIWMVTFFKLALNLDDISLRILVVVK